VVSLVIRRPSTNLCFGHSVQRRRPIHYYQTSGAIVHVQKLKIVVVYSVALLQQTKSLATALYHHHHLLFLKTIFDLPFHSSLELLIRREKKYIRGIKQQRQ
jgi:hypothetical protein